MKQRPLLSLFCLLIGLTAAFKVAAVESAEQGMADIFIRQALSIMALNGTTSSDGPVVLSEILLDQALELDPDNEQAWALRAELAESMNDPQARERALVGYLDTGVEDDAAYYDLVMLRVGRVQTIDGRLRALEQLLNSEEGREMSNPLRSRLANEACSLAIISSDEDKRRQWAVEAARTDPGNVVAAENMYRLVVELGGDEIRRGTALVNIIRADPVAPLPRMGLAEILAEQGAYERAAQQYRVVATRLSQQPMPDVSYVYWANSLAMSGDDQTLRQLISEYTRSLQAQPEQEQEQGQAQDNADASAAPAVPLMMQLAHLSVLNAEGDEPQRAEVYRRLITRIQDEIEQLEPGDGRDNAASMLCAIAAVYGPDEAAARQLVEQHGSDPVALGWLALRADERDQAGELLSPHAEDDSLAACGMAILTAVDNAGLSRMFKDVIRDAPMSMGALVAGRKLLELDDQPEPTTAGQTLIVLMNRYPTTFWLVDLERTPWLNVSLSIDPRRINPTEPINATLTLWNTTRFPLAIGENAPIKPVAFVIVSVTTSGRFVGTMNPIPVELDRTFTIPAGRRLHIDTRLDYHQFGSIINANPNMPFIFDARLIVNPVPIDDRRWTASGIGGTAEVRNSFIQANPVQEGSIDRLIDELDSEDTAVRLLAIRKLAGLDARSQPELVLDELLDRIRGPLGQAWEDASEAERAWIIYHCIDLTGENASFPEMLERATQTSSELVWIATLLSQPRSADAELFRTAIGRLDMPEVSRMAERQRTLLREREQAQGEAEAEAEDEGDAAE